MIRADSTFAPFAVVLALASPARAQSRGATVAPGVTYEPRAQGPMRLHVVRVDLCDPHVSLRVTGPTEGRRTVRAWANTHHAVVAINGDYFDAGPLLPLGPSRGAGVWWPSGRRVHHDALVGFRTGYAPVVFAAGRASSWPDAEGVVGGRATDVIAVREQVLAAGEVRRSPFVPQGNDRHPRTGIGLSRDRHTLILLVVEGHAEDGEGARADELGALLRSVGAWDGFKLDGGGSSTLVVHGRTVNHPSDGHDRVVANMLGVMEGEGTTVPAWCGHGSSGD